MNEQSAKDTWLLKAYNNPIFLNSPAARTIRILTEMVEPAERLRRQKIWNTVVFFGSARTLPPARARKEYREYKNSLAKRQKISAKERARLEVLQRSVHMSKSYQQAVDLACHLTKWFNSPEMTRHHFHICSGGGPGIMEAANRGAKKAGGKSIGLNISLPMEQTPNPYQTKDISFEFHYFFIRKFWFFYLSKAMAVFPGGFGTLDELFELLTLIQTKKTKKHMPVVLFGSDFWNEAINFRTFEKWGMISPEDLRLFRIIDDAGEAFEYLKTELTTSILRQFKA
jgi:uncharacterized protein (TIGR00730 family)